MGHRDDIQNARDLTDINRLFEQYLNDPDIGSRVKDIIAFKDNFSELKAATGVVERWSLAQKLKAGVGPYIMSGKAGLSTDEVIKTCNSAPTLEDVGAFNHSRYSSAGKGLSVRLSLAGKLAVASEKKERIKDLQKKVNAEIKPMREARERLGHQIRKKRDELRAQYINPDMDWEERERIYKEIIEPAIKEAFPESIMAAPSYKYDLYNEQIKGLQAELKTEADKVGAEVIRHLLDNSAVSEADAKTWVDSQYIDKSAIAKLARRKYSAENLKQDMAEFYRLCNGKVGRVSLDTQRARRSSVKTNIGLITVGSHFDKWTLFHEMAHIIENDPTTRAGVHSFLKKRGEGCPIKSLRSITGNKAYKSDEVAYNDSFFDPYVGKIYRTGNTEILSMGFQTFADPLLATQFMLADKEHFEFIVGLASTVDNRDLENIQSGIARAGELNSQKEVAKGFYRKLDKEAGKIVPFINSLPDYSQELPAYYNLPVGSIFVYKYSGSTNYYVYYADNRHFPQNLSRTTFRSKQAAARMAYLCSYILDQGIVLNSYDYNQAEAVTAGEVIRDKKPTVFGDKQFEELPLPTMKVTL